MLQFIPIVVKARDSLDFFAKRYRLYLFKRFSIKDLNVLNNSPPFIALNMLAISTRPIIIAKIKSHLWLSGSAIVVAPMLIPFVVKAEPTSNIESIRVIPIVEKARLRTISMVAKPVTVTKIDFSSCRVGRGSPLLTEWISSWMRCIFMPPAMLNAQPPARPIKMNRIFAG